MLSITDVQARARSSFDRNWRDWACSWYSGSDSGACLKVGLRPPREQDLASSDQLEQARLWVREWRDCTLGGIDWEQRSWARVGNQSIPVRVRIEGAGNIARWAQRTQIWETALQRLVDLDKRIRSDWAPELSGSAPFASSATNSAAEACETAVAPPESDIYDPATSMSLIPGVCKDRRHETLLKAMRASLKEWCELDEADWQTALNVWNWLFAHPGQTCYVRQLPIRGIDTKWMEAHGKALKPLYYALASEEVAFSKPPKQFLCKACCPGLQLGGCSEFSLSASQMNQLAIQPRTLLICENKVNVLCLDDFEGTLAIHGSGFAVSELAAVHWLVETPILYWGDLDSNGFAILNALRAFAPHARSVLMDTPTLNRHFDLCVNEPKPATGTFDRLTSEEADTLHLLAQGDPTRGIGNLRLEQERIEWAWAIEAIEKVRSEHPLAT